MINSETSMSHSKTVDRFNQEKLYIQLTRILLEEIRSGNWKLNDRIPSEDELSKTYNISKITVRQAINNLTSDGYLMKFQGKGTFVTSNHPIIGLSMKNSLSGKMFENEVNLERVVLFKGVKELPPTVKEYLKTDDTIYYILTKRMADGTAVYLEEAYILYHLLPYIEVLDITTESLYSALQEKGTRKLFKMLQTIEISTISGDFASQLSLEGGSSVLVVHRLFFSTDNLPVAYTKLQGRSDKYKFQTEFERIR